MRKRLLLLVGGALLLWFVAVISTEVHEITSTDPVMCLYCGVETEPVLLENPAAKQIVYRCPKCRSTFNRP